MHATSDKFRSLAALALEKADKNSGCMPSSSQLHSSNDQQAGLLALRSSNFEEHYFMMALISDGPRSLQRSEAARC